MYDNYVITPNKITVHDKYVHMIYLLQEGSWQQRQMFMQCELASLSQTFSRLTYYVSVGAGRNMITISPQIVIDETRISDAVSRRRHRTDVPDDFVSEATASKRHYRNGLLLNGAWERRRCWYL